MAAAQRWRTPSKATTNSLAMTGDRFALLRAFAPRVPVGTRRIADVKKVGPANPDRFKIPVTEWDTRVKANKTEGRCGGTFCASFNKKQTYRQ